MQALTQGLERMGMAVSVTTRRARFENLYAIHSPEALRVAYQLVGNRVQAEDLVQEAFIRVLGRFGELRSQKSFRSYLMRTVVNLTKAHFRRRAVERRYSHVIESSSQETLLLERNEDLWEALHRLPRRQRIALVLRYCEDLSEQQTAEILQTSTKAVKSLVTRGLAALREQREGLR